MNPIKEVGIGLEKAGVFIGKEVGTVFGIIAKTEKVLVTVIENESDFRTVLSSEITQSLTLASKVNECIVEKGLNLEDDLALLTEIKAYFMGITSTFIPEVEKIYGQIVSDTTTVVSTT